MLIFSFTIFSLTFSVILLMQNAMQLHEVFVLRYNGDSDQLVSDLQGGKHNADDSICRKVNALDADLFKPRVRIRRRKAEKSSAASK